MSLLLHATAKCDYCARLHAPVEASLNNGRIDLTPPEGWAVLPSGRAVCTPCQVLEAAVHIMQGGVTLCGITDIPNTWPKGWKWMSIGQKDTHHEVTCLKCKDLLKEFES